MDIFGTHRRYLGAIKAAVQITGLKKCKLEYDTAKGMTGDEFRTGNLQYGGIISGIEKTAGYTPYTHVMEVDYHWDAFMAFLVEIDEGAVEEC